MAASERARLRAMASSQPPPSDPSPTIPSASILLISPSNQILLLNRVVTSSAFPSAHVFPGGHIDAQDGILPPLTDPRVHQDSEAYRMGAIRECFEESGILLAKQRGAGTSLEELLNVREEEREAGRKAVHDSQISFRDWVAEKGGVPDLEGLIPFTRWLTPKSVKRRYTTQMYLYFLPLLDPSLPGSSSALAQIPTSDGGIEHTEAVFDYAGEWLRRSKAGEIVLFPPQVFLLTQIAPYLKPLGRGNKTLGSEQRAVLEHQRVKLLKLIQDKEEDPPWAEKCISPRPLLKDRKRVIMGLDHAGDEVQGTNRRGDLMRVMVWRLGKSGPAGIEVRMRSDIDEASGKDVNREREKL